MLSVIKDSNVLVIKYDISGLMRYTTCMLRPPGLGHFTANIHHVISSPPICRAWFCEGHALIKRITGDIAGEKWTQSSWIKPFYSTSPQVHF